MRHALSVSVLIASAISSPCASAQTPADSGTSHGTIYVQPQGNDPRTSTLAQAFAAVVPTARWQPNTAYPVGAAIYDGTSVQKVTHAGTSSSSRPRWNFGTGQTQDNTVTWTSQGYVPHILLGADNNQTSRDASITPYFISFRNVPEGAIVTDERMGGTMRYAYHPQITIPGEVASGVFPSAVSFTTAQQDLFPVHGSSNQNSFTFATSWNGRGFNGGSPWSVGHNVIMNMYSRKPMIAQNLLLRSECYRVGDCSGIYQYIFANPGKSSSSDEGVESFYSSLEITKNSAGHVNAPSSSAPSLLTYKPDNSVPPGGGLYLTTLPAVSATSEFYVTEASPTSKPLASNPRVAFPWSQLLSISTHWPGTEADLHSTIPPVSHAFGIIESCTTDADYPSTTQAAAPFARKCVVDLDPSAVARGGFSQAGGLLCLNAGVIDTASLVSATTLEGARQTLIFTSVKKLLPQQKTEIWQGGPCGLGIAALGGDSIEHVLASQQMIMYPIVGSPSPGIIAVGSAFLSGQQGPGYGLRGIKHDATSRPVTLRRHDGIVSVTPIGTDFAVPLAPKVHETVTPIGKDQTFSIGFDGSSGTQPIVLTTESTRGFLRETATYKQAGPDATSQGTISLSGWDNVAIAPIAEVLGVSEPDGAGTYSLDLNANTFPALQANARLDFAHYWEIGGYGSRNLVRDTSASMRGAGQSIFCDGGHDLSCVELTARGEGSTPQQRVLNWLGVGISLVGEVAHPLSLPASAAGAPAIYIGCPGGDIDNKGCDSSLVPPTSPTLSVRTRAGQNELVTNVLTGSEYFSTGALHGPWLYAMAPGTSNPITNDPLATDGSQSIIMPRIFNTRGVNLLDASSRHFLPGLSTLASGIDSSDQPLTIGDVKFRSRTDGIAIGDLQEGSLRSNIATQINNVTIAAPAPVSTDNCKAENASDMCLRITPSSTNTGKFTRRYFLTGVTAVGETNPGITLTFTYQAAQLTSSANNVITCPASYFSDSYTAHNLYVMEGTGTYLVGQCPIAVAGKPVSLVDQGSASQRTPAHLNSRNISATLAAAQLQLANGDLCWLADTDPVSPAKAARCRGRLTETESGQFSFDGVSSGDHAGSATAKTVTLASSSAPATPTAGTLYYDKKDARPGACSEESCSPLALRSETTVFVGTLRTSNKASDALPVAGLSKAGHCMSTQTAQGLIRPVNVIVGVSAGTVTIYHASADAGATFDLFCTVQ